MINLFYQEALEGLGYLYSKQQNIVGKMPKQQSTVRKSVGCPGRCGLVGWVSSRKPKGGGFDSQSGHMPGLQAPSPVGGTCKRQLIDVSLSHQCFSPPLSPSLSISLESIKKRENLKKRTGTGCHIWLCVLCTTQLQGHHLHYSCIEWCPCSCAGCYQHALDGHGL